MRGQVQATEVAHQVPEDDGVLAEEGVGVDDLQGATPSQALPDTRRPAGARGAPYLVALVLQQGLQLFAQHQGAEVRDRHRFGVCPLRLDAVLEKDTIVSGWRRAGEA